MADSDVMGLQSAFGAAGAAQALRQLIQDRIAAKERERVSRQQEFQNDLELRKLAMLEQDHGDARALRQQQERDTAAAKVPLSIGDSIDQPMFQRTFAGTSTEPLFTPQKTLPATQTAGAMPLDQSQAAITKTTNAPQVLTGRLIYGGTDKQRTEAEQKNIRGRLLADPNLNSRERLALQLDAAGMKAPAGVFEPNPATIGEGSYMLKGQPIVAQKDPTGHILYHGQDVTNDPTLRPYVAPPTTASTDNRLDRSYQYHRSALDKLETPLAQQADRLARLTESVNQGTPQADALIAPELLTAMAGGQGSGLRMNEAEISRIVGGRSKWESLKASLQQWAADPSKANSITPDQRQQIRALLTTVRQRVQSKADALTRAGDALVDATDVSAHRRIVADVRRQLQQLDNATIEHGASPDATVRMRAPNGQETDVPADQVEHFKARGAVVVR